MEANFCIKLSILLLLISIVKHLEMAYNNLDVFGHCGYTRKIIFQLFMKLRANGKFHLGVEEERGAAVHFSPYLICRSPMKV